MSNILCWLKTLIEGKTLIDAFNNVDGKIKICRVCPFCKKETKTDEKSFKIIFSYQGKWLIFPICEKCLENLVVGVETEPTYQNMLELYRDPVTGELPFPSIEAGIMWLKRGVEEVNEYIKSAIKQKQGNSLLVKNEEVKIEF